MNNRKSIYLRLSLIAILCSFFPFLSSAKSEKNFVVVLDAGHGGGDVGTPHRKCKKDEKTIALDIVLRLGKMIEANHKDVTVVYTRKKDVYPSLPERTKIAKEAQSDLFISIHVNAAPNSKAHGFETYVFGVTGLAGKSADEQKRIRDRMANERENLDIDGKQVDFERDMDIETKILCQAQREKNNIHSEEVAKLVHNALISGLKRSSYKANVQDRGVKEKNIFVLCYSPMPAILVELGYMSNDAEEKFINSEEAATTFTKAIYSGFAKYKSAWEKRKLGTETAVDEASEEAKEEVKKGSSEGNGKTAANGKVIYKIQFLSSDKLLKTGAKELKGLAPVGHYQDGKVYRYTFGAADTSAKLSEDLKKVKKLFPDAFIIKTDEKGNRIR